ncbi:MAG: tRNA pseudouridine(55) synthase TruB [Butyrivibrio sp.]|nr:tRNA pseudouridine(55) synthase TruB [Butyrivibrio sp.]
MKNRYNGLINVYKEPGFTSNDVVAKMRGILKQRKIGHTGTLDPDAVGVLVVCVGTGTKLVEMLTDHSKEYIAVCRLGVTTDTQDMSGNILCKNDVNVTSEALHAAVHKFVGDYDQIPPMYSAIKVGGKKLYELAREGKEIDRQPRKIHIDMIRILDESHLQDEHTFTMEVKCSKGTYIRTLCNDIGECLGCGGAMEHLTRTRVGSFGLENAYTLSQIEKLRDEDKLDTIVFPSEYIFKNLDIVHIKDDYRKLLENGNSFKLSNIADVQPEDEQDVIEEDKLYQDGTMVRVYSEDEVFFGIYKFDERTGSFRTYKFFFEKD